MLGEILLKYHVQDVTNYVKNCPHCLTVKGDYVGPKTKLGTIIVHNPMDLLCLDFTKVDPSKDSKENILCSEGFLFKQNKFFSRETSFCSLL